MLKMQRENINMSQKELANLLNVTQGAISQWESGITKPTTDKLPALAKIFGCPIDDLFKKGECEHEQSNEHTAHI